MITDKKWMREGFWYCGKGSLLPKPHERKKAWKGKRIFLKALSTIESKILSKEIGECKYYKGWSDCRICDKRNGEDEFYYKNWCWPSGYYHYVDKHNIRPSLAFQEFVLRRVLK
jgi:hypothetical protein